MADDNNKKDGAPASQPQPQPVPGPTTPQLPRRRPVNFAPWHGLVGAAAMAYLVLALHAAWIETPTVDEFAHVPAGCAYLTHGRFDLYSKNPPLLKCLMALPVLAAGAEVPAVDAPAHRWGPWRYGDRFMGANADCYLRLFVAARVIVILIGLGCGALLFHMARQLLGHRPAAIVTTMFWLSPTILAHGHLATLDVGCMFTIFLTVCCLWWAYRRPTWRRIACVGMCWGAALLVKFTAVVLLPAIIVLIIVQRRRCWLRAIGDFAAITVIAVLVINAAMGFAGSFDALGSYAFESDFARAAQRVLPDWMAVPLPRDYLLGFDAQKLDTEQGEFGGYLLGRWSDTGWWYYDLLAFAVKTPLPLVILLIICPFFVRRSLPAPIDLLTIVVPLVLLVFFITFFSRLNIGIRYLLPIYPFLYLLTGCIWRRLDGRVGNVLALVIVIYLAVTAAVTHPAYLSYFNVAAGGTRHGHRYLADSNLDWGQDLYRVKPALKKLKHDGPIGLLYYGHVHPAIYGIDYQLVPDQPIQGVFAVSVNYLLGAEYIAMAPDGRIIPIERNHLAWLRWQDKHKPILRAGSIWIFDTRDSASPR